MSDIDKVLDELFGAPGAGKKPKAPVDRSHPDSTVFVWDIETGPQSKEQIEEYYVPLDPPPPFDPKTVKVGNLKPENAAAKVMEKRAEHAELVANFSNVQEEHRTEYEDTCALSPMTGRVLTSQYLFVDHKNKIWVDETGWEQNDEKEAALLASLWERVVHVRRMNGKIIGYNLGQFDVPFCLMRSYYLGIDIPDNLFWKNRYLDDCFLDLYQIVRAGRYERWNHGSLSLGSLAQFLKCGSKEESGERFWHNYRDPETRNHALEYAKNDVKLTYNVAKKLKVIK
jgi:DNA polymerase elongation subunit (family B)